MIVYYCVYIISNLCDFIETRKQVVKNFDQLLG